MKATAAVTIARRNVQLLEIEVPGPGPEDVVIRLLHSWISNGTEGSFIRGERIAGDTPRRPGDPLPFPLVTGYQKSGVVEWVGAAVRGITVGDVVFATVSRVCGMFEPYGGHVSPAVTHHSQVWRLGGRTQAVAMSGLVLTQVGVNAAERAGVQPGDSAVVLGDGLVGQWAAQALQHFGARVLLAGHHDYRLRRFEPRAGSATVNTSAQNLKEVVREWAPSGARSLVHTAGSVADVEDLLECMAHAGNVVSVGFLGTAGRMDIQLLRQRELALHAPAGWSRDRMDRTLQLVESGAVHSLPLITHHYAIRQAHVAFSHVLRRPEPTLGVLLDW